MNSRYIVMSRDPVVVLPVHRLGAVWISSRISNKIIQVDFHEKSLNGFGEEDCFMSFTEALSWCEALTKYIQHRVRLPLLKELWRFYRIRESIPGDPPEYCVIDQFPEDYKTSGVPEWCVDNGNSVQLKISCHLLVSGKSLVTVDKRWFSLLKGDRVVPQGHFRVVLID